jgi:hypothetical protein
VISLVEFSGETPLAAQRLEDGLKRGPVELEPKLRRPPCLRKGVSVLGLRVQLTLFGFVLLYQF